MLDDLCIVDTETTGVHAHDTPVEVAALRLRDGAIFHSLVDPERAISDEATAVHGLTASDVFGAPPLHVVGERLIDFVGDAVLVAHNAPFDARMLPMLARRPWLCTMRLALHLLPGVESTKNQFLYELLVGSDGAERLNAHRAQADVRITEAVLFKLLALAVAKWGRLDAGGLLARVTSPYRMARMPPWGRYPNRPLSEVPTGYLSYVLREWKSISPDLRHSVELQLGRVD